MARRPKFAPNSTQIKWLSLVRRTLTVDLAPLRGSPPAHPSDLWVNERYQDAVQQYGIEGHLRKLTEEYQVLSMQHPDDLMYSYLYARSLMGRNTASAIQQMNEIVASIRTLLRRTLRWRKSIRSTAFHDEARGKAERERFLALCRPGSVSAAALLRALPDPSPSD